jgi:hypothetical protein
MDTILESFLRGQQAAWEDFSPQTDAVRLTTLGPDAPPRKFVAQFSCRGLVRLPFGEISETNKFAVGIYFGDDHLRRIDPLRLVWLLEPQNVWHPNVSAPGLCVGHLRPGVGLIEILQQVYSILTYQNCNLRDYLSPEAAAWARTNLDRFPIDRRPLKRKTIPISVREEPE